MKKSLLFILAAAMISLTACHKDADISLSIEGYNPNAEGETFEVVVNSVYNWTASIEDGSPIIVNPTSGNGGATSVKVTVPVNPQAVAQTFKVTFTSTDDKTIVSKVLDIVQLPAAATVFFDIVGDPDITGEACSFKVIVKATEDWTMSSSIDSDEIVPSSGTYGETEVTISFGMNKTNDKLIHEIDATSNVSSAHEMAGIIQPAITSVTYGDINYKVRWMKDGKLWMCENLRYVPEGKNLSENKDEISNGVWYPVKVNDDKNTVSFDKSEEGIAEKGYLYTMESALGLATGAITAENANTYEGAQGICPEGYHIPTLADIMALVGKCAGQTDDANAPYYFTEGGTSTFKLLEGDGFAVKAAGMISVAGTAATTGTIAGAVGSANAKTLNTGYSIGSTFYKTFLNTDNSLKNIQYYAFMPNVKNETFNGAYMGYKFGGSLRCVRTVSE